jgi:hypothetical protein
MLVLAFEDWLRVCSGSVLKQDSSFSEQAFQTIQTKLRADDSIDLALILFT